MSERARLLVRLMVFAVAMGMAAEIRAQESAQGNGVPPDWADRVEEVLDEAKDLGAKGQLPLTWWDLDQRFKEARDDGAGSDRWELLLADAVLLRNQASFVREMRRQKSGLEAMLGRFDQALEEIAALNGIDLQSDLTGSGKAARLIDRIGQLNFQRQVQVDSLVVANRYLSELVGGRVAAQESLITSLQVEISSLRQRLWETELRAGVAEADRSAAESELTRKQEREDTLRRIRESFTPQEGEILVTASGGLIIRVHGISFAVGSSELQGGQDDLVSRLATTIGEFPGAAVKVEGHTDDTGSRDANLRLSRRRADSVARLLESRLELPAESIATEGFGPDRPVALNSSPEGRALNRRIDIVIN